MCLRVTGPLRAMKCPSSEPISTMVLQRNLGEDVVAQVAQHSAGVGQLGAAQVDLVVRHHLHELKDLLPPETLGPSMWSTLKSLAGEGVVRRVGKLLPQLQVVQDEPVAVVGNAQGVGRWRWQS